MDDLLAEFLEETNENLAILDTELVKFEQDPSDSEILGNIFRLVHTIKGTSGFLGLPRLEKVAHRGEDLLGQFRDGKLQVTPAAVTLILKCIDRIRELLTELGETGEEPAGDDTELVSQLEAMASGETAPAVAPPADDTANGAADEAPDDDSTAGGPVTSDEGFPVAAELLAEYEAATSGGKSPVTSAEGFPVAAELLEEYEAATAQGIEAASDEDMKAEMEAETAAGKAAPSTIAAKETHKPEALKTAAPLATASAKVPAKK
ncbi:MAG: Hpt domain-containing protein, partial [Rhodospirillales bacterium]